MPLSLFHAAEDCVASAGYNDCAAVCAQIKTSGIRTGRRENHKEGRAAVDSAEADFMSSSLASNESLNATGHFLLAQSAKKYPAVMVINPSNTPPIIITPIGSCIS